MDPDPLIRTTDFRVRILLFSLVADKLPTKNKLLLQSFFFLLLFEVIFTSVFKDEKSKRSHKIVETKFFLLVLFVDGRIRNRIQVLIRIRTNIEESGSRKPKIIRIPRIRSESTLQCRLQYRYCTVTDLRGLKKKEKIASDLLLVKPSTYRSR